MAQPARALAGQSVVGAYVDADQFGVGPHGHARCSADEDRTAAGASQGDQHPLLGLPLSGDAVAFAVGAELFVDPVGNPQQGQLSQRGEVPGPEVVRQCGIDAFGGIDVSMGQPPLEGLGSHVDQLQLVSSPHHAVGNRLLLGDTGDPLDDIVERLEVLEVDGGDDVDTGFE